MAVTASTLYNLVQCPQRVALDAFGDPAAIDEANPFVRLLWERGTVYEREVIESLDEHFVDLSGLDAEEREAQTLEAMRRGEPLIYGGRIAADDLLGSRLKIGTPTRIFFRSFPVLRIFSASA